MTAVQIYDCNGSSAQQWRVRADSALVNVGSGKCLDANAHGTASRTVFVIGACNQKWSRS